jgi:hypothetical protein
LVGSGFRLLAAELSCHDDWCRTVPAGNTESPAVSCGVSPTRGANQMTDHELDRLIEGETRRFELRISLASFVPPDPYAMPMRIATAAEETTGRLATCAEEHKYFDTMPRPEPVVRLSAAELARYAPLDPYGDLNRDRWNR